MLSIYFYIDEISTLLFIYLYLYLYAYQKEIEFKRM